MNPDLVPILYRLALARRKVRLSQRKVAEALKLSSQQTVSRIERQQQILTVPLLLQFCQLYTVSPCWVLTGKDMR